MMKMKHNKEFMIKIKAGTNHKMTKEEFYKNICKALSYVDQTINGINNVRFHLEVNDEDLRLVNKWDEKRTNELVEKIKNLGN